MSRAIKLFVNLALSSVIFTFFVQVLVHLLNSHFCGTGVELFLMFINLYIFYGPLWFIFTGTAFLIIQFFAEKKYQIGIFHPPTLTYFLAFASLIISVMLYLNYDYYYNFLGGAAKFIFIRTILINLALLITGIVFVFFKKINKKWIQLLFYTVLIINIGHSYYTVRSCMKAPQPTELKREKPATSPLEPAEYKRRKIRIVLMDGLSLNLLNSLISEQKLLNFNEIIKKGVCGRIKTYKPNLSLSMLNSVLSGLPPSEFSRHSDDKFKFTGIDYAFDVRPRFIFFRKSPYINTTTFYKSSGDELLDNIMACYENDGRLTRHIIRPPKVDFYSERSLHMNNRFVPLFPDLLKTRVLPDEKYERLKKTFFLDDYIKNMIPQLKDSNIYYSVVSLPGLGIIGKYFYQYHMPQIFGNTSQDEEDIKKYGGMIDKYYEYYDSIIGNLMSTTGEGELLVILSFYEYEPLPVWRRILVHLFDKKDVYVYKSLNSQGTILMYEKKNLKEGYPLKTISIYDIYPTLLYYAGFSLSKDLKGEIIQEIFTSEFKLNNPIDLDINYTSYPR